MKRLQSQIKAGAKNLVDHESIFKLRPSYDSQFFIAMDAATAVIHTSLLQGVLEAPRNFTLDFIDYYLLSYYFSILEFIQNQVL